MVLNAAVFGVSDDVMGQAVTAVVRLVDPTPGTPVLAQEVDDVSAG